MMLARLKDGANHTVEVDFLGVGRRPRIYIDGDLVPDAEWQEVVDFLDAHCLDLLR
jgi:hypothetical protein